MQCQTRALACKGAAMTTPDPSRLSMPIGEAMFTQRAIRRFKPDPIPIDDLHLVLEAAVRAPNGGNQQVARFLVVTDRDAVRDFGALYREAWWAKRHDEGFADFDAFALKAIQQLNAGDTAGYQANLETLKPLELPALPAVGQAT